MSQLLKQLRRFARDGAARQAILSESYTASYAELLVALQADSYALRSCGIGASNTVGVHIQNEVEHFKATLALLAIGARQIVLPSYETDLINGNIAEEVGVSYVLSDSDDLGLPGIEIISWDRIQATRDAPGNEHPDGRSAQGIVMIRTSGSTGHPKTFELSESQLFEQADRLVYEGERMLRLAPIESNGSKRQRIFCAFMGGTNVFRPSSDENLIQYCLDRGVTWIDASRVHISSLMHLDNTELLSGVSIQSSGMEVPFKLRKAIMEHMSPDLYIRYATTEIGTISIAGPADHDHEDSVGKILDGVSVEVVGTDQRSASPGTTGEIRIKAPGMATEYYKNPEETKARFSDGWFYPGDMGHIRQDGHLVIDGRKNDMMILNGINIYPSEIEKVLEKHPDVSAAAALPLRSEVHGQIPVALVTVSNKNADRKQLLEYCRANLGTRSPRQLLIAPELPRNETGKIARKKLSDLFSRLQKDDRRRR
jgi:acyl-coenzyme A synthetase/AMP-(fatty) acid ligase